MPVDLNDLRESVAQAVFANDGPREDWFIRDIFIESASEESAEGRVIAHERVSEAFFDIGFDYDGEGATLADRDDWAEVTQEWVPVSEERMEAMEAHKQELIGEARWSEGEDRSVVGSNIRMSSDGERTTVQFMTEQVARDGLVIEAEGLDVSAYRDNPVVLWQHGKDPRRGGQPIARTVDLERNEDGWLATIEWYDDDFSQEIKRQVKEGFLNAVSIGWRTEDMERNGDAPRITEADMTEFSFVGVPADTGALVQQRGEEGLETTIRQVLRDELPKHLDNRATATENGSADAVPEESASDATGDDAASEVPDGQAQASDRARIQRLSQSDIDRLVNEADQLREQRKDERAKRKLGIK